ncbi:MmcB family DNA repair protein [Aureimonas altamirensis]|uniref:MmcB family DNA repair protein n=1 Tax=Aureimonas altamirensis TaxID=370622 RepID=UPI002036EA56|nr:MmcB family DNA repair protein [Aureimonas altamirensis]MCM2505871.1 MmcB family DNA repair protein [Aureimonas altamirensis]
MPIVSSVPYQPLLDGRQSDRAMLVRRGVQRLMMAQALSVLPEMPLASGRRADLVCLSAKGEFSIVEIKTSIADFRVDRKWPDYRLHCDRLFFATHPDVPIDIFPQDCGLILSDGYGAEILRDAPSHRMPPATRKALTLRFATLAANRLLQAEWAANPYMTGSREEIAD